MFQRVSVSSAISRDIVSVIKTNMKHPNCFHQCSGNCRRVGCNCQCGEFHDTLNQSELDEILEDTTSMEEKLEALESYTLNDGEKINRLEI